MSTDNNQYFGQTDPTSSLGNVNALYFAIWQQLEKLSTSMPVRIRSVSASGVAPVGLAELEILVSEVGGNGRTIPGAIIPNVPYMRYQGGNKAVIIDPEPGDIGIAVFSSRDISSVKRARAAAPPGSKRSYDCSDAMYIGGVLNKTPTHYIHFTDSGILVHTPGEAKIEAATAVVTATTSATIDSPGVSIGAGGQTLRALIDERIVAAHNTHTHPSNGAVPSVQIDVDDVSTTATKAN